MDIFQRTRQLIGEEGLLKLQSTKVALFGLGGVGSYVNEALVRAGIGHFIIVDKDIVDVTNINRQLIALQSTIGKAKVEVARSRMLDINPDVLIDSYQMFYLPETKDTIDLSDCNYIIDAIDNVTAKILLVEQAKQLGIPIISCLGTGNKLDPKQLKIDDIAHTHTCPLAKVMRKELKQRNINDVKVLFSTEEPLCNLRPPASISYVPSVAGLMIAAEVVNQLLKEVK